MPAIRDVLLDRLTDNQKKAVKSAKRRVLVVAGAGSGKTEVMARRVAWWIAIDGVSKDKIVAFTFTERAAEEMKFRIREQVQRVTPEGADATLGAMYVGTIHGFCLKQLRDLLPDRYHNFDVIDEAARFALTQRGYYGVLGLPKFQAALERGRFQTIDTFLEAYDLLNEYDLLDVELPSEIPPLDPKEEADWCKRAVLRTNVGKTDVAEAFALSAGRYYAYLQARRFLDFSTSQSELQKILKAKDLLKQTREQWTHIVVDEMQDINPVQNGLIRNLVGQAGHLTAVGDHRQAIFAWRGGRVDIMGGLYEELKKDSDGENVELPENFRSTPRIIDVANEWASTIGAVRSMRSPAMRAGNKIRKDYHATHVSALAFEGRDDEAAWIAETIRKLVPRDKRVGAQHDTKDGARGLTLSDVAVLVRSSTDVRTYLDALEKEGVPAVVRAGPDLFRQPEVLLFVAALARMTGVAEFLGAAENAVASTLGGGTDPASVIKSACKALRKAGLSVEKSVEDRLLLATDLIHGRIEGKKPASAATLKGLRTPQLIEWLGKAKELRRIFPQTLYHFLLAEGGVAEWDAAGDRGQAALFHLGQLSTLITGVETPGWTSPQDLKYQVIALCAWSAKNARVEEAPLLVPPDAVTVSTIHSAKGLEFSAVFLADIVSRRFPSGFATRGPALPFDGPILKKLDPNDLIDNDNRDGERRLMYVALTRAERYLFVSCFGKKGSEFFKRVGAIVKDNGGTAGASATNVPANIKHLPSAARRDWKLTTSFSDLRYFLECPHDFYLRKVLGFAPTIDQAFGYGRGLHNLLREVHSNPKKWAKLASDPKAVASAIEGLIRRGLFHLRYTTGDPAKRMQEKAVEILGEYVGAYAHELERLDFEPEREFETLISEENVLISGAIDVIRLDDPPRITVIDFKSGEPESDRATRLDEEEMRLQISVYGLAAKKELEYEPEQGAVRYLGETDPKKRELPVELSEASLKAARAQVVKTAKQIKDREFHRGPTKKPRTEGLSVRCGECDFCQFCGMADAKKYRAAHG